MGENSHFNEGRLLGAFCVKNSIYLEGSTKNIYMYCMQNHAKFMK